jgi:hypothetical protein
MNELLAEVKAARRADAALQRHTGRIKELLVEVRRENPALKLADLEAAIGKFYDRATISRVTADAVKEAKRKTAQS